MTTNLGQADAAIDRQPAALSIWATGRISLSSADRVTPPLEGPALLFVEEGSVTAQQGDVARGGGKLSLMVFAESGRITLSTTANAVVHWANVLNGPAAAALQDGAYVCELDVFAKASAMLGDTVEVTTVHGIEVAVSASTSGGNVDWRVWRRFSHRETSAGVPSDDEYELLIRRTRLEHAPMRSDILDLAIIGAGPTGTSLYAHAKARGLDAEILGEPLAFWKRHILPLPLRSPPSSTNIDCPQSGHTFLDFVKERCLTVGSTIPFPMFVAYFCWFMKRHGVQPLREQVVEVKKKGEIWHVITERNVVRARNVAIAVGMNGMQRIPNEFRSHESAYTHVSNIKNFTELKGRSIAIVGGGQSAVEAAVAMSAHGIKTHLVIRGNEVIFRSIHSPGNLVYKILFRHVERFMGRLSGAVQDRMIRFLLRGTTEPTLEGALRDSGVKVHTRSRIVMPSPGSRSRPRIDCPDRTSIAVDHVVLGTGYQYDVRKIAFLKNLPIWHRNGLPFLNDNAECSQAGMYFCGISALRLIGPQCQFVFGSKKLSPRIISGILGRRKSSDARVAK